MKGKCDSKRGPLLATILLVDDEEIAIQVTREILETNGYRLYTATTGHEAIARLREETDRISMVSLDMIMPGMACAETLQQLRLVNPYVNVIQCSGYGLNNEARQIMQQGISSFLQKPIHMDQLLRMVNEMLATRPVRWQ